MIEDNNNLLTDKSWWRSHVDLRIIVYPEDWIEYCKELDEYELADHLGEPDDYPAMVATAYLKGQWIHECVNFTWIDFINKNFDLPPVSRKSRKTYTKPPRKVNVSTLDIQYFGETI